MHAPTPVYNHRVVTDSSASQSHQLPSPVTGLHGEFILLLLLLLGADTPSNTKSPSRAEVPKT